MVFRLAADMRLILKKKFQENVCSASIRQMLALTIFRRVCLYEVGKGNLHNVISK